MKLMLVLHYIGASASLRTTYRGGEEFTHLTAFSVGGSLSEGIMSDKYNVKELLEQILRAEEFGTDAHVAKVMKVKKSDNQQYYLCEWKSDVSKGAFAKVYWWTEDKYVALSQWARSNSQPKIVVKNPLGPDTTADIDQSQYPSFVGSGVHHSLDSPLFAYSFKIFSVKPFKWDNRPKQYRMVAIKVTGEKRNELINKKKKLKVFLDYVLLDASDPNYPKIEIKKIVPDDARENWVRVGFVTKMTETEISAKLAEYNYGPLNNIWIKQNFPKQIFENGTIIESTTIDLKIIKITPDFESSWYSDYHLTRGGHNTHLTAFSVSGLLSENVMLDATKMKDLLERIIIEENHRVETNHVTITKLRKADNKKSILCEWRSDLSKDQFGKVFDWTDEQYAGLNQWARTNLKIGSIMNESEFQILKIAPFKWDTNEEGLQMVAIKLTGTEKNRVYEDVNLEVLLEHVFADKSDPNHPKIKIWRQSPAADPDFKRVAFLTKIPLETISAKLDDMDYGPLNLWAKKTFTLDNTVHELKIISIIDDFELGWYREYLGQDWNLFSQDFDFEEFED